MKLRPKNKFSLDQRNPPDQARIGDPDDIIGSVLVVDGEVSEFPFFTLRQSKYPNFSRKKINAETYQPMPSYRVCTSDGVLQLTPGLAQSLQRALIQL